MTRKRIAVTPTKPSKDTPVASAAQAVNGLMTADSDVVIPPTDFAQLGRLVDAGDLKGEVGATKTEKDMDVPLSDEGAAKFGVAVMTHKAFRLDH
jgi:hypothetical protein